MFGKKSGLNGKLRSLLARIQREFDAPKVYAVRCHIKSGVNTFVDPVKVRVRYLTPPTSVTRDLQVDFPVITLSGGLESAICKTMEPLSELQTTVRDVPCWQAETFAVNAPKVRLEGGTTRDKDVVIPPARYQMLDTSIAPPTPHRGRLLAEVSVRGNLAMARMFPFRLRVVPMNKISKRLLIRYRTGVLKNLSVKPTQVKFVGVSLGLPRIPLSILKYEPQTTDGYDYVEARASGAPNPQLGRRVWVFIRMMDEPRYIPVTLKEE